MPTGSAPRAPSRRSANGAGAAEGALLALRRAAFTGALEKPVQGEAACMSQGEAEAEKEAFWRGHAKVWVGRGRREGGRSYYCITRLCTLYKM